MRTSCSVGIRIVAQELDQGGENARRAEAALQAVVLVERLLDGMQLVGRGGDAFDGEQLVAVRLHRQHEARARRAPIEQDGAGAAHAVLAAEMGAGEPELMAHEVGKRHAHLDLFLVALAVDRQCNLSRFAHRRSYSIGDRGRSRLARCAPSPVGRGVG